MFIELKEIWKLMDSSTIVLSILTLISLLVIYLQHKRILLSPYFNLTKNEGNYNQELASSKEKTAQCRECSKHKPISELKMCSNCKISITNSSSTTSTITPSIDLNFYYCDRICQKLNWKTHKLICGNFKNLQSTSTQPSNTSSTSNNNFTLPPPNLFNINSDSRRTEIEGLLKKWCEFHRNLLIFAAIHGLDLIRNPKNSNKILLMISLNLNEKEDQDSKIIELNPTQPDDSIDDSKIHKFFSIVHIGSLDYTNFLNSNPGMINAFKEMEKVRIRVTEKGGVGAAILLVRYGAIVHIIPVGLPSQMDLDAVPRQTNWRSIFDDAIKTGLPWKPPTSR